MPRSSRCPAPTLGKTGANLQVRHPFCYPRLPDCTARHVYVWGDGSLCAFVSSRCVSVCRADVKKQAGKQTKQKKRRHSALVGHWVVQTDTHECPAITPHASEQAQSSCLTHFRVCSSLIVKRHIHEFSMRLQLSLQCYGTASGASALQVSPSQVIKWFPTSSTPGWMFRVHGFLFRSDVIELLQRKGSMVSAL